MDQYARGPWLTLHVSLGQPERVSAFLISVLNHSGGNRLYDECLVRASSVMNGGRFLLPKPIYVFVKISIDLRGGGTVVMTGATLGGLMC